MTGIAGRRRGLEQLLAERPRVVTGIHRPRASRRLAAAAGSRKRRGAWREAAGDEDRPRWPALVVGLAGPVEKGDQVADLVFGQVLPRHQPAVGLFVVEARRVAHVGLQIRLAAVLGDLRQIRGVIGAFPEQRVAVDAVVLVPHVHAVPHLRRDVLGVGQLGKLAVAVQRKPEKQTVSSWLQLPLELAAVMQQAKNDHCDART